MADLRSYPMIAVLAVVIAGLLLLDYFYPNALLYQTEYDQIDSLHTYTFVTRSQPCETKNCLRYEAEAMGVGRVLMYIQRDSTQETLQTGDTVVARTRIQRGKPIGNFNYGLYLRRQGIVGTAYVRKAQIRPLPITEGKTKDHSLSLQKRLYNRLMESGLDKDELAITAALTLGYKEDLDPQIRQHFQASGAAHVLAVSGLHTGIIYLILMGILTLGKRVRPKYENQLGRLCIGMVVIGVMWMYAWITGMTPSVVRCVIMITLVEAGKILYRNTLTLNTIAAAAVLILLVRPLDLWSLSFQLSFSATAAIVVLASDLESVLQRKSWRDTFYGKAISWIVGMIIVSIAAQIGTLPITMYTFGQVSTYFLLTNIIILPIASLLVPFGMVSIALGGCGLGRIISYGTYGLAWAMNHAVAWIEHLPGSVAEVHIDGWMVGLLYAAVITGWMAVHKSIWWLVGVGGALIGFGILFAG